MENWAAVKAAYRFFANPRTQPEQIMAAHRQAVLRRIAGRDVILVAQDTTQFNFTTHRAARGMGPTGAEGLQGFLMHSALAIAVDGIPPGLLGCHTWRRPDRDETRPGPVQKESERWLEMLPVSTADIDPGTRVPTVADREADLPERSGLPLGRGALGSAPCLLRASARPAAWSPVSSLSRLPRPCSGTRSSYSTRMARPKTNTTSKKPT
jgi:hypothetical protein